MAKKTTKSGRKTAPKRASAAKQNICLCGCGEPCGPNSFFKQGHDARMKGYILRIQRGDTKGMSGGMVRRIKGLMAKGHEALSTPYFQAAING